MLDLVFRDGVLRWPSSTGEKDSHRIQTVSALCCAIAWKPSAACTSSNQPQWMALAESIGKDIGFRV